VRLRVKSAFLLTLLVATATNAWSADGRILSFEGDVRVNGQPANANTVLQREDTIVTADGASARIVLTDNSVLDLDSGSEIQLSDYSYDPSEPEQNKSDISVVEGSLRYVSGLIAKENSDNVSFTAGNSTIGVRGSFTGIEVDGVVVNVEAMIGEATLKREEDGQTDSFIVPTGQTTLIDPTTGETLVVSSTVSNKVNTVVRAIAAAAPDAHSATGEGCSRGDRPLRRTASPDYDPETQAKIQALLADLTDGELMMVIAVLHNNARHLCIDSSSVATAIGEIGRVRPELVAEIVFVAALIDSENAELYAETALAVAPNQSEAILQAVETAIIVREGFGTDVPTSQPSDGESPPPEEETETELPPGGGAPSPE
jgi:hypothetical protein